MKLDGPRELIAAHGEDEESGTESEDAEEDVIHQEYEPLEESIYGFAVSMIIRDTVWISAGTNMPLVRAARVLNSFVLIACVITLQVFLLFAVSRLLSAPAVLEIRETYSDYEELMYPNHTFLTVNGFKRGVPGFRVDDNFRKMDKHTARKVCEVPLSHPFYLMSILFIWTMTCQIELRAIFETTMRLLWSTPMVHSNAEVVEPGEGEEEHCVEVRGLTPFMKFVIGVLVLLPRTLTLIALLYLGCRWLTATLGLGDVLLNGLALEFLVLLKELLYNVTVSHRNRVDTQRLLIRPFRDVNKATFCTFFDSQAWAILSAAWAWVYVYHVQMVLPHYGWDLAAMCKKYLPVGPLF
uniref:Uncharacterized protein n=1 Tax=Alexandrium catenella TaxID=2925 RepID=A0A7S1RPA6_ALECA